MKLLITAAIAMVLVVQGQADAKHAPRPVSTSNTKQQSITPQSPAPSKSFDSGVSVAANQQAPNSQESRPTDKPKTYFERLIAPENIAQIVLSMVGIIGVVIAVCTLLKINQQATEARRQRMIMRGQLGAMKKQLVAMRSSGEQTDKLIKHAENQVDALIENAKASINIAKATLLSADSADLSAKAAEKNATAAEMAARAAMGVAIPTLRVHMFKVVGDHRNKLTLESPRFQLTVKNFGNSPAFVLGVRFWAGMAEDAVRMESYPIESNMVVVPNGTQTFYNLGGIPQHLQIAPDLTAAILHHKAMLIAEGEVLYRDIFDSPVRVLTFGAIAMNFFDDGSTDLFVDQRNEYRQPDKPHTPPDAEEKAAGAT